MCLEKPLDYLEAKICEANIFLHTSAPVKALLPALQVAKISEMNNIEYYRLVSCLIVVEVQCQMHQFEAAQNNLERIEPLLRNSVPPLYQGKAYLLRAHIKATCCTQSPIRPGDILQKSNILSSALNDVQLALGCFQKMELCFYIRECHFFKAMIQEAIHSNDECLSTRVAPSDWFPHRKETKQQIACYEVLEKLNKL